jgi:DNA-binding CsgD family transcriptional regulator
MAPPGGASNRRPRAPAHRSRPVHRDGAEGFGERARRELLATGVTARTRAPDSREELTAQETEIARLAALGRTNPEIGAQLFISPRTVEWHLRKVFVKLGVSSRKELYDELRVSVPG